MTTKTFKGLAVKAQRTDPHVRAEIKALNAALGNAVREAGNFASDPMSGGSMADVGRYLMRASKHATNIVNLASGLADSKMWKKYLKHDAQFNQLNKVAHKLQMAKDGGRNMSDVRRKARAVYKAIQSIQRQIDLV